MAIYRGNTMIAGVGKGFNPQNVGEEGQVLTKTATGYAFCDSQGGGDTGPKLDIMVVGGGGSGGSFAGGGGGGGAVKKCRGISVSGNCYSITIGTGGVTGGTKRLGVNGGDTGISGDDISIVSKGGGGGGYYCSMNGLDGGNGGGSAYMGAYTGPFGKGGIGYEGNQGGGSAINTSGGGGGAGGPGSEGSCGGTGGIGGQGVIGGDFKPGLNCLFGTGGVGSGYCNSIEAYPGGGTGGFFHSGHKNGCNATYYGGGGGGAACQDGVGGTGYQGIVIIKYPTDGSYGIASSTGGDNCYTCDGYCYVEFTQNGTFTPTYS